MKISFFLTTLLMLIICLIPQSGHSCTTFCLDKDGQLILGKNYDWMVEDCFVVINKRGVKKSALKGYTKGFGQSASWTSKYGSITFNQYGREFPAGGMNEAGLVIESMLIEVSEYPEPDSRAYINFMQWQQYQLDNFSSVEEVIASNKQIRIENAIFTTFGVHYLVCDRKGKCAIIEFLKGNMLYYTNKTMPVKVLTNITYKELMEFWEEDKQPANDLAFSVERFATAATLLERYNAKTSQSAVDYAFDILKKVQAMGPIATVWSIVYDIKNFRIHFRTLENQEIRYIDIKHFDFSCKTPVKVFDIQSAQSGDVTKKFIDYSQQINQVSVKNVFNKTVLPMPENDSGAIHLNKIPENLVDSISKYPETTICTK
jgi:choloylglycine hydrolase